MASALPDETIMAAPSIVIAAAANALGAQATGKTIDLVGGSFDPTLFDEEFFDCGTPVGATATAIKE